MSLPPQPSSTSEAQWQAASTHNGQEDDDLGAGDLSLSVLALSASSSSGSNTQGGLIGSLLSTDVGNDEEQTHSGDRSYQNHPFAAFRSPVASPTSVAAPVGVNVGASSSSSSSSSSVATHRDARELAKPARPSVGSRDSLSSAISGAYYSAEEDIADGPAAFNEATPRPSGQASRPVNVVPTTPTPSARSSKRAGKARQRDPPSPPLITPRRASLGSKGTKPNLINTALANERSSSRRNATPGSGSSSSARGGDLAGPLSSPAGLSSPRNNPDFTPRRSSRGLHPSSSSSPPVSATQSPEQASLAPTSASGLGLQLPPERDLSAFSTQRLSVTSTEQLNVERNLLQRWILSIGCVNFDLEKGPDLELLSPPLDISREEKDNIAFSAFPDTSIFDVGDTVFSFRVREVPLDASVSSPPMFGTAPTARRPSNPHSIISGSNGHRHTHSHSRDTSEPSKTLLTAGYLGDHLPGSEASSGHSANIESEQRRDIQRSLSSNDLREPKLRHKSSTAAESLSATGASTAKFSNSSSSSYIHGYVFFRQKRDASIRRGYFQKSLVILSHLPYVALFSDIVAKLGPLYFEHGEPMLEAFCHSVAKWPNPSPGATLPLPLFGTVLWVALPLGRQGQTSSTMDAWSPDQPTLNKSQSSLSLAGLSRGSLGRQSGQASLQAASSGSPLSCTQPGQSEEEPILASIPLTPLISVFKEALSDMWLIWECLLLSEPVLVIGPDPRMCSEAVWHLLDICRPIPHAGDFRPFFTIHDYDFKNLATRKQPPAGTIIGCTNPFLAQACAHWPHVLRVGKAAVKLGTAGKYGKAGSVKMPVGGGVGGGTGAGGGGPEHLPGFATKKKRRVSKDRPLLKKLMEMVEREENIPAANAMLRRYFADITERFLAPLNRYVSSLIPPATTKNGVPVDPSHIKPFNTDAFLASLKAHGTPLPLRSRSLPTGAAVRQGLYLDFLRSPNFSYYLTERIAYYRTRNPVPSSTKSRFEQ